MHGLLTARRKKASKHPEEFGDGSLEAICASETANNAVTGGSIIPLIEYLQGVHLSGQCSPDVHGSVEVVVDNAGIRSLPFGDMRE